MTSVMSRRGVLVDAMTRAAYGDLWSLMSAREREGALELGVAVLEAFAKTPIR
jgi:hypothetical protein